MRYAHWVVNEHHWVSLDRNSGINYSLAAKPQCLPQRGGLGALCALSLRRCNSINSINYILASQLLSSDTQWCMIDRYARNEFAVGHADKLQFIFPKNNFITLLLFLKILV